MIKTFCHPRKNTPFAIEGDTLRAEWCYIGEGYFGDYDPDYQKVETKEKDGEKETITERDEQLLRFDVYHRADKEHSWEAVENGSFCTLMPLGIYKSNPALLLEALRIIFKEYEEAIQSGNSVKKTGELLSWISPEDLQESDIDPLPKLFDTKEYLWYKTKCYRGSEAVDFYFRAKDAIDAEDASLFISKVAANEGLTWEKSNIFEEVNAEEVIKAYGIDKAKNSPIYMAQASLDDLCLQANTLDDVFSAMKLDDLYIDDDALEEGVLRVLDYTDDDYALVGAEIYRFLLHDALCFVPNTRKLAKGFELREDLLEALLNDAEKHFVYLA